MAIDAATRDQARRLWTATACGERDGDQHSLAYFLQLERERYREQDWAPDYFQYAGHAGKRVLEIGVGQGSDLMQFAKAGAICTGLDITDRHLALTRRHFQLRGKEAALVKADAVHLPFPDDHFDCVYSFGVLHHVPEMDRVLREAHRVLQPGGTLMLALYHKWSAFHLFSKLIGNGLGKGWLFTKGYAGLLATVETGADGVRVKPYVKLYTRGKLRRLLKDFTVEDLSVHQLKPDHFLVPLLARALAPVVPELQSRLGWYLACKARKDPAAGRPAAPGRPG